MAHWLRTLLYLTASLSVLLGWSETALAQWTPYRRTGAATPEGNGQVVQAAHQETREAASSGAVIPAGATRDGVFEGFGAPGDSANGVPSSPSRVIVPNTTVGEPVFSNGQLYAPGESYLQPQPYPPPQQYLPGEAFVPGENVVLDEPFFQPVQPGGLFVMGELMLLRYHRADGTRAGPMANQSVEFDLELAPRVTLGYVFAGGFGGRFRWWYYDHEASNNDSSLEVDTTVFDAELFAVHHLNPRLTCELSAGLRFNDFTERMTVISANALRTNTFNGFGGIVGLEGRQVLYAGRQVDVVFFGRARGAILMDDKTIMNTGDASQSVKLLDVPVGMAELAIGFETAITTPGGTVWFIQTAAEWQQWYNYSSSFDFLTDPNFDGQSDVGFGGVVLAVGVTR